MNPYQAFGALVRVRLSPECPMLLVRHGDLAHNDKHRGTIVGFEPDDPTGHPFIVKLYDAPLPQHFAAAELETISPLAQAVLDHYRDADSGESRLIRIHHLDTTQDKGID